MCIAQPFPETGMELYYLATMPTNYTSVNCHHRKKMPLLIISISCHFEAFPLITQIVRNFVYDIAKVGVGKNWTQDFIRRHKDKLDSGFLRMMDLSRKKADNVHTYRLYFEQVRVSRYFKIKLIIK